ncbi:hypothetical protein [Actinoplanes couchii]|nr:hypothetical protein [Actinoplanes couchii]MDR6318217.1 hypothetical protein [Actinoplanes couchii]
MSMSIKRFSAAFLALVAAVVGFWAGFFPLSFHEHFPIPGWGWVANLGPYNEHLVRDYGLSNLALLVFTVWAFRKPTEESLRVLGGGWLVYSSFHFLWHMFHLAAFPTWSRIGAVLSLALIVVFSILPMIPEKRHS